MTNFGLFLMEIGRLQKSIVYYSHTLLGEYCPMDKKQGLKVKSKIWIEFQDEVVFGLGRIRLFEAIEKTGSISQAAAILGMSYRAAWGKVTATEERLNLQLVDRQPGNRKNGTSLTLEGKELLRRYSIFQQEAQDMVDQLFENHVGELFHHLNQSTTLENGNRSSS